MRAGRLWLAVVGLILAAAGLWAQPPERAERPHPLEKLRRLAPEERERVLQNMPPERRQMIEERLERWERMAPRRKKRLEGSLTNFQQMKPEQQQALRKLAKRFQETMPEDKRMEGRRALTMLRRLAPEARRRVLNGPRMRDRFNEQERELLREMAENMPD
ncbi:MAG: DUF3106 domain-containing protein [Acidobacteria bacterium]|nr:DUF3106 domain-containing protein [Acidobacteriota bacterium]